MAEEEIYQAAKELATGPERETFLASACDNDAELWKQELVRPRAEFAPTGNRLAVATGGDLWGQVGLPHHVCHLYLIDGETGKLLGQQEETAHRVAWSNDGRFLVAAHKRNAVVILDASTGKEIAVREDIRNIQSVALSPDGKLAAAGSRWGGLLFGKWQENESTSVRKDDKFFVSGLSFSPDGTLVAAAIQKRITEIWNVAEAKLEQTLLGQPGVCGRSRSTPWIQPSRQLPWTARSVFGTSRIARNMVASPRR